MVTSLIEASIVQKRYIIKANIPHSLSILLLTDLHNKYVDYSSFEKCDLAIIAGDFVRGKNLDKRKYGELWSVYNSNAERLLSYLPQIMPVYLSLGNHEGDIFENDIESIRNYGITVLDNDYVTIDNEVVIGGLTSGISTNYRFFDTKIRKERNDYKTGNFHNELLHSGKSEYELNIPNYKWLEDFEKAQGYKILISHHPEYWNGYEVALKDRKIDLVLSGHAHGGQIRLFNQGLYAPGQGFFPKFTKGIYQGPYGKLIVSAGMSNTSVIPRLFNPPEIVVVNLEKM